MDHPGADRDQVTGGIRYVTDVPYIAGFTAELAPEWLDLVATICGFAAPRRDAGFAWCELGCGPGMAPIIFAATHPEGEFHGVGGGVHGGGVDGGDGGRGSGGAVDDFHGDAGGLEVAQVGDEVVGDLVAVLIGDEDCEFAGGSYVIVQKYVHDLAAWNTLPVEAQERIVGRTKL